MGHVLSAEASPAGTAPARRRARAGLVGLALTLVVGCAAATPAVQVVGVGAPTASTTTSTTLLVPRVDPPVLDAGDGEDVLARYDVIDGQLTAPVAGDDLPRRRARFARFQELIPLALRQRVVGYLVFKPDDDSVAFVSAADDANATWILGLSDNRQDDRELDATLLHESAHVATLNETQLDTIWSGKCVTYESLDGCLRRDSYLLVWVDRFWRDLLPELADIEASSGPRTDELVAQFFASHRGRFVREYAATNPEEDIAETFSAWALGVKPRTRALEAKFAFFEEYPIFRELRAAARAVNAESPR